MLLSIRKSLTLKLIIPVILIQIVFLGGYSLYLIKDYENSQMKNMHENSVRMSETVIHAVENFMVTEDNGGISGMLKDVDGMQGVEKVFIASASGKVAFSSDGAGVGEPMDSKYRTADGGLADSSVIGENAFSLLNDKKNRVVAVVKAIENQPMCNKCHDTTEKNLGYLGLEVSADEIFGNIERQRYINIIFNT